MKKLIAILMAISIMLVQTVTYANVDSYFLAQDDFVEFDGVIYLPIEWTVNSLLASCGYGEEDTEITTYLVVDIVQGNDSEEISIPQEVNGFPVTHLSSIRSNSLKVLNLPKTVFYIAGPITTKAECPNLTQINLDSDESIIFDYGIFCDCKNLKYLTADKKNVIKSGWSFGNGIFAGTGVEKIVLDRSLFSYFGGRPGEWHERYVFARCENLRNVYITSNCKAIGKGSFKDCTSLDYVYFPETMSALYGDAFKNCSSLRTVWLTAKSVKMSPLAFEDCTNMTLIGNGNAVVQLDKAFTEGTSDSYIIVGYSVPILEYTKEHNIPFIPAIINHGEPSTVVARADQTATVTINGVDIPAYTVNGSVYVGESALKCLGFTMDWDSEARTTTVIAPENVEWSVELITNPKPYSIDVVSSDVEFWYNDFRIPALNVGNGESIIDVNALAEAVLY